jgi:hypothetical protein
MKTSQANSTYLRSVGSLIQACGVASETINGIDVLIAPDRNVMGLIGGRLALWRLAQHADERKTLKLARAPSQLECWETIARQLSPRDLGSDTSLVCFMDEIRGNKYQELWESGFVDKTPPEAQVGAYPIQFGDGSEGHARHEAERLNAILSTWRVPETYCLSIGGTSPTLEDGPSECHIAFHREDIPGDTIGPYMAIPMSDAGSRQQQREGVVESAGSINQDWVVSMTAHTLTQQTDDLILLLPENRGYNLYRILHESPDVLPAAQIQRHCRLKASRGEVHPSVVVVTIEQSWKQYLIAAGK